MFLVTTLVALVVLANAERIIDTDTFFVVDDVGALAIANVFHNTGDAEVVGVMVNTPSKWDLLAVSVRLCRYTVLTIPKPSWSMLQTINTYYGNGEIPVAAIKPATDDLFFNDAFFSSIFLLSVPFHGSLTCVRQPGGGGIQLN